MDPPGEDLIEPLIRKRKNNAKKWEELKTFFWYHKNQRLKLFGSDESAWSTYSFVWIYLWLPFSFYIMNDTEHYWGTHFVDSLKVQCRLSKGAMSSVHRGNVVCPKVQCRLSTGAMSSVQRGNVVCPKGQCRLSKGATYLVHPPLNQDGHPWVGHVSYRCLSALKM